MPDIQFITNKMIYIINNMTDAASVIKYGTAKDILTNYDEDIKYVLDNGGGIVVPKNAQIIHIGIPLDNNSDGVFLDSLNTGYKSCICVRINTVIGKNSSGQNVILNIENDYYRRDENLGILVNNTIFTPVKDDEKIGDDDFVVKELFLSINNELFYGLKMKFVINGSNICIRYNSINNEHTTNINDSYLSNIIVYCELLIIS